MKTQPLHRAVLFVLCLLGTALFYDTSPLTAQLHAADGAPIWTNRFSGPGIMYDFPAAVATDGNGNVFVTGFSINSSGNADYATLAYSGAGLPLWTNRYNGPNRFDDYPSAMAVDGSGNVFVTGYSYTVLGGIPDYVTLAYSGAGVPLWTNRYDGPASKSDYANAVAVDRNGNVFVTGNSTGSGGDDDYATVAYSGAGVPLWTNRYNGPGNTNDIAGSIAVDSSGNVFVTGYSYASGGVNSDYATVAYSGAGVPLWTNRYNGPGNDWDYAYAVAVDRSGNVFVTGKSFGIGSGFDYATVAYSGAGVPLWTNRYNGPGNGDDYAHALSVDERGNVFVTGQSVGSGGGDDYATVAYSGAGVPLWTNRYNGPGNSTDQAYAVAVDSIGDVFVTGSSFGSGGVADYATVAYSGAGAPLWTNRYNDPGNQTDRALALAVDGGGNVFVTGLSYGSPASTFDFATIKYTAIALPPLALMQSSAANGEFRFQFNADSNLTYAVEFSDVLNSTNWMTLTNITAQATNIAVINAITNNARFYRVRTH